MRSTPETTSETIRSNVRLFPADTDCQFVRIIPTQQRSDHGEQYGAIDNSMKF